MRQLPFFKIKKGWSVAGTGEVNGSGGGGGGGGYTLPIASADTLGGVKVGDGLSINASGVLSASGGGGGGGGSTSTVVKTTGNTGTINIPQNSIGRLLTGNLTEGSNFDEYAFISDTSGIISLKKIVSGGANSTVTASGLAISIENGFYNTVSVATYDSY